MMYGIIMCKNGMRQLVVVDNYVPTKDGTLAYSRTNGKEMWVIMLEKAWAKIHGSYERIEWGDTQTAVRDLTGAPGETYDLKDKEMTPEDIWDKLVEADKNRYIICCSVDSKEQKELKNCESLGLVPEHAYTMIGCVVLDDGTRLCKIRNPWGNFEWKGDWSDSSDLWTNELKKKCKFTEADDGTFFMCWEDAQVYFSRYSVNKYVDDYELISLMAKQP